MLEKSNPNKNILVTVGSRFFGSLAISRFVNKFPEYHIYDLEALNYVGNFKNLLNMERKDNYAFPKDSITNKTYIMDIFNEYHFESAFYFAGESYVDRSITNSLVYSKTKIYGSIILLKSFKGLRNDKLLGKLFYRISTEQVYGAVEKKGLFEEITSYDLNSTYSASKSSSDHFIRTYGETYDLAYMISNCSNHYMTSQFPEKLIPMYINNIIQNRPLPVYEDSKYRRHWFHMIDHDITIALLFYKSTYKYTYNVGGFNEWENIYLVKLHCRHWDDKLECGKGSNEKLITCVTDGPGYEPHYEVDASKINRDMGWSSSATFEEELTKTTDWYLANEDWLNNVSAGDYQDYYKL
ncbi:dTDP-glucose 4,6-dehydratase [Eudoraea adriatica]|uniref:dTDP-glucose 4,6-dehydratase n=1 Tax=Eudoraea adriatica TaxID=446681 RepID=UPI00037D8491|nr:GDP-mannose 4,6-dehydratase [Eudoraea adriatica]